MPWLMMCLQLTTFNLCRIVEIVSFGIISRNIILDDRLTPIHQAGLSVFKYHLQQLGRVQFLHWAMRLDPTFGLKRHCTFHHGRSRRREIRGSALIDIGRVVEVHGILQLDILDHERLKNGTDFAERLQVLFVGYSRSKVLV
jgi:hypothetical protein